LFAFWKAYAGGFAPRLWLPPALMKFVFAPLEPIFRIAGLPAIFSRETVMATVHLNYSSAKAQRELGWSFPKSAEMWPQIIEQERRLLTLRAGLRAKMLPMEATPADLD
jgi:hypothetical protein